MIVRKKRKRNSNGLTMFKQWGNSACDKNDKTLFNNSKFKFLISLLVFSPKWSVSYYLMCAWYVLYLFVSLVFLSAFEHIFMSYSRISQITVNYTLKVQFFIFRINFLIGFNHLMTWSFILILLIVLKFTQTHMFETVFVDSCKQVTLSGGRQKHWAQSLISSGVKFLKAK